MVIDGFPVFIFILLNWTENIWNNSFWGLFFDSSVKYNKNIENMNVNKSHDNLINIFIFIIKKNLFSYSTKNVGNGLFK